MMTANKLFVLVFCMLVAVPCLGQEGYKRVASAADLVAGATCVIVHHDTTRYHNLYIDDLQAENPNDTIKAFCNNQAYKTLAEAIANTEKFTIKSHEGNYYLYNDKLGRYINSVTMTITKQQNWQPLFYLTDKPHELGLLTVEAEKGVADLKIGSKYLRHHVTSSDYRLAAKGNKNFTTVEVYVTTTGQEEAPTLTLSANTDLGATNFNGNVRLERTFEDNYLNTIVLPFEVSNPRGVFGSQTKVYELKKATENAVVFAPLAASAPMKANTPYLISGTFASPPYLFKNVSIVYDLATTAATAKVGNLSLHGVYQQRQMGGTQYFVLYRQKFYCCKSVAKLGIEPYKWYLETSGDAAAKSAKFVMIKE